jgi:hypothetical protein
MSGAIWSSPSRRQGRRQHERYCHEEGADIETKPPGLFSFNHTRTAVLPSRLLEHRRLNGAAKAAADRSDPVKHY